MYFTHLEIFFIFNNNFILALKQFLFQYTTIHKVHHHLSYVHTHHTISSTISYFIYNYIIQESLRTLPTWQIQKRLYTKHFLLFFML